MKNLRNKIEKAIIRQELSYRGGGIEIDLTPFGFKDEMMTAYQNYLGGGMLGRICNDCTIIEWQCDDDLMMISEELSKFMHELTNPDCEWAGSDFIGNLNRPVAAY
tara:strand:- start:920 stop:1237 length:318 start_codon:yes stop_codon:yes gene_type:complete